MMYLLDTNIVVAVLRGTPPHVLQRLADALGAEVDIRLSSIVLYELWLGVARSDHPVENKERLELFVSGFPALPFDDADAAVAGALRASLERRGEPIGPYDFLIAAQALRLGATLVTANTREFSRVPDLVWEDWTRPASA